ncbi:hypothetical protein [Jeotgalibacillus soli]|uniref:Uncharacterized protein n=1 Tax=Jeotgalibacillus soli TaxID=889306 RepID=A0A0C2RDX3_9BACL|nr:hypothetical protein [Jeotgalibacillus soli]KIL48465.1 hypothetical protein KP78_15480 [Jeotgalibacillus soli]
MCSVDSIKKVFNISSAVAADEHTAMGLGKRFLTEDARQLERNPKEISDLDADVPGSIENYWVTIGGEESTIMLNADETGVFTVHHYILKQ